MKNLFEEAEGWEFIRSLPGSPGTTCHILGRYTANQLIKFDETYAFKTISIRPPATTKFISNKSITFKYKDITQVSTEIKALERLRPYRAIVQLHQVMVEDSKDEQLTHFFREFLKEKDYEGQIISLILEYCSQGTLKDAFASADHFSKEEIIKKADQICDCLLCLRDSGVLHRDIRTTNLLLTQEGIKLTDFDTAFLKNYSTFDDLSIAINKNTTAPELIRLMEMETSQKELIDQENLYEIQKKCDIYSFGCILFELVTKKEFKREKIKQLEEIESSMEDLRELIKKMLLEDVEKRASIEEVEVILNQIKEKQGVTTRRRQIVFGDNIMPFVIPQITFTNSIHSQSQSNSLSLSDWSLQEPVPQLYRKEVEHPDMHPSKTPTSPLFQKLSVHHTMFT